MSMESFSMSCGGSNSNNNNRSYGCSGNSYSSELVLDSLRGELVEAPARLAAEKRALAAVAERSVEALKNHSEAERRRRARINAHFDTLRRLLPGATKMDKASLLGEVINHLRDLKRKATKVSEEHSEIPNDTDEVKVEQLDYLNYSIKVSLSCDYRPGLLSDLRRSMDGLDLITTSAAISTLGSRMKNVFVMTSTPIGEDKSEYEALHRFRASSIVKVVKSVLENEVSSSDEFFRSSLNSNKRPRATSESLM